MRPFWCFGFIFVILALASSVSGCYHPHLQAAIDGDTSFVLAELDKGVDVNKKFSDSPDWTLLHGAAYWGRLDTSRALLDRGADVNAEDYFGRRPLHLAVLNDSPEIVQLLLERDADVNAKTNELGFYENMTPLHIAALEGRFDIARLLLDGGAEVEVKDQGGRTPLYVAVDNFHHSIVQLLVERGADPNARDNDGKSPIQLAQDFSDTASIQLLMTKSAVAQKPRPINWEERPSKPPETPTKSAAMVEDVSRTTPSTPDISITLSYPPEGHHTNSENLAIIGLIQSESGVNQIELSVNGQPIPGARDLVVTQKSERSFPLYNQIPLAQGENIIGITVFDNSGGATQVVRRVYRDAALSAEETKAATPTQTRTRWAVVIGIDQYQDSAIASLAYAVADAQSVYTFLTTQGGVNPTHARLLLNNQATQRNVRSALGEFLREKALQEDEVIIYYAGHGTTEPDPGAEGGMAKYLVPWDADPGRLFSTAIPMEEINRVFGRLSARKVLLVQDTCFSGGTGGRTFLSKKGLVRTGSLSDQFLQALSRKEGRMILTSSDVNQLSQEDRMIGHGLFTYFFLEGLKGSADLDHDGAITVREVHLFLQRKVHERSGGTQTPQLYSLGDMVLLHN